MSKAFPTPEISVITGVPDTDTVASACAIPTVKRSMSIACEIADNAGVTICSEKSLMSSVNSFAVTFTVTSR